MRDNEQYTDPTQINITNKQNMFSILTINIRSLNKNFHRIKQLLTKLNFNPSIICVCETCVTETKPFLYSLKNYTFINSASDKQIGGAGMFINNNLNFNKIEDYNIKLQNCEDIWISLKLQHKTIIITTIYRHPSYNFKDFQEKLLNNIQILNNQNKMFILSGDININLLSDNCNINNYKNEILSQGTLQLVELPTRITEDSQTLIDHIYTNIPEEDKIYTHCLIRYVSDHIPILTLLKSFDIPNQPPSRSFFRDMTKFNCDTFSQELNNKLNSISFENSNNSANDLWDTFFDIFSSTYNKHCPLRPRTRREQKRFHSPWITRGMLCSINTRQKLYRTVIKNPNALNWSKFRYYRNKLTHIINNSKRHYFKKQILNNKSNPAKTWKTLNNIINFRKNRNSSNTIKIQDNTKSIIKDPKKVSNLMNNYFTKIGSELANNINPPSGSRSSTLNHPVSDNFFLNAITVNEILLYIGQLNPKKATKTTDIPIKIIKLTAKTIAPYLTIIFNKCISEGTFPENLKAAEVIPLYKQGNKFLISNHRPISILSPFAKLFELHIHNQLTKFINKHQILHKFQYGFRTNSSTEMAITQIIDDITSKLDNGQLICTIFLDLKKAFDTVDHQILLNKLYNYGIRGLPAKLINSYLTNRTQQTIIGNTKSDKTHLTHGVPQGSILAPLFFNLYINDIINSSKFSIKLFADDACLICSSNELTELESTINRELININNWRISNKLSVNFTKSNFMLFSKTKKSLNLTVTMDGNTLERVNNVKYLGITLNDKLKWNNHIQNLTNKLSKSLYIITKIRHYVDINSLKMLYYSLIHPHLNYCITVWGGAPKTVLKPLINLQKKAMRIMTYSAYDHPSAPLFSKLNLIPLNEMYTLNLSLLMYKIHNNAFTGQYNLIQLNNLHTYNTRSSSNTNYFQQFHKTNQGLNAFTAKGIKIWNQIPVKFKILPLHLFKKNLSSI